MKYQIIRGTTEEFPYGVNIKDSSGTVITLIKDSLGELMELLQRLDGLEFFPTTIKYANMRMITLEDLLCTSYEEVEANLIMYAWNTFQMRNDEAVEGMWSELEDVPVGDGKEGEDDHDEESAEDIDIDFMIWSKGTNKFDIWHWFDEYHSKGAGWLVNDYCSEE